MRVAWFSPLPPSRSGIAAYSAEVLPHLRRRHFVDAFDEARAHDFVWMHQRDSYDLVVYQLGNAVFHDYMWAYLARYPGLVVLHDARLHQARARRLLRAARFDDYRAEFWHDHPGAVRDFAEYAIEGLGGPIYYFWSMLRIVLQTARLVAVHNDRVADDLRAACAGATIETIRMGVPAARPAADAAARVRRAHGVPDNAFLFAAFGKVTAEKRIGPILRALERVAASHPSAHLLVVGDAGDAKEGATLSASLAEHDVTDRVHLTGFVDDGAVADHLAAADACLCLRWPTALETSASWLRCLAAARPTVISDLAHLVDIPTIESRTWRPTDPARASVAISVDLVDEDSALLRAMTRLVEDAALRGDLARAGHAYWQAGHTLEMMAADYERVVEAAGLRPPPVVDDLPRHFTDDHGDRARALVRAFGLDLDTLLP